VGLKLIFLIVSRAVSLLGLSRREAWWKDAEILMLRHQLAVAGRERPGARARLTWPDRALLALLAGTLPIDRLAAIRLIVTPATILRWHRDIVRRRWSRRSRQGARQRTGRSGRWCYGLPGRTSRGVTAVSTASWPGSASPWRRPLSGRSSRTPASNPRPPGGTWLGRVPAVPGAGDPGAGLLHRLIVLNGTKVYVLAVIEHGTRRIRVLGTTGHPVQAWVVRQARNLLMDLEDVGKRVKFVLHDRDASLTAAFDEVFRAAGARIIRAAVQAPRMNSIMERWVGSCRRELLDRTLVWNLRHLMIVLREYEDFYNTHRPHRALKQAAPLRQLPDGITDLDQFRVQRRDRAAGVIHEYRLVA
jgi:putative transposase